MLALLICLLVPAASHAAEQTFELRYGPVQVGGFHTAFPSPNRIRTPRRTGYVVRMSAQIVDSRGRRIALGHAMMHHVVFINNGHRGGVRRTGACTGRDGEPFFGTGEENQRLILPRGYGYRVDARDRWRMVTMIMGHRLAPTKVWLEYRITMQTSKRLTPVKPLWLRGNGCDPTSSYTVQGGGAPGSADVRSADWRMPISGRIVAAGAHLHGGAKALTVSQPRCGGRTLIDHRPRWGLEDDPVYRVRPLLHEPGPIATGYFLSRRGIPVRRHETLRVAGVYDGQLPHPAVMAITHVYIAHKLEVPRGCPALPSDARIRWTRRRGRTRVAPLQVPLTGLDARGRPREISHAIGAADIAGDAATVSLTRSLFAPPNLSIAVGGVVTWRSLDAERHVVMLANGPRAVDSPLLRQGQSYTQRFDVPGTYNLFCYLHPVTMHQTLVVQP